MYSKHYYLFQKQVSRKRLTLYSQGFDIQRARVVSYNASDPKRRNYISENELRYSTRLCIFMYN